MVDDGQRRINRNFDELEDMLRTIAIKLGISVVSIESVKGIGLPQPVETL